MTRWSQSKRGPVADAVGASMVTKRRRPPHTCRGDLSGPKAK